MMTPTQLASLRVAIAERMGKLPWLECPKHGEVGEESAVFYINGPVVCPWCGSDLVQRDFSDYPTDPAAALDVIAALGKEGWEFMAMKTPEGEWMVAFSNAPQMKELIVEKVNAPTLPLAVALAAAKVWGIKI